MLTRMVLISWPRDPPALASQSAGITGLSHHARPACELLKPDVIFLFEHSLNTVGLMVYILPLGVVLLAHSLTFAFLPFPRL